jgi:hypothetical protein
MMGIRTTQMYPEDASKYFPPKNKKKPCTLCNVKSARWPSFEQPYNKTFLASKGMSVLYEPPCHERTMGSSSIDPHILNKGGRHKQLPSCPYHSSQGTDQTGSWVNLRACLNALVNNPWKCVKQSLAKKILLDSCLPMSMHNSKKNLLILHFQTSVGQLVTHMIHTFHTGTPHWWLHRWKKWSVYWEQNVTSISQIALDGAVRPYTEFWFPNYKHTPYSEKTHTLTRLSTVDDERDRGEIPHLVPVDSLTKITLLGMSCHVVW